MCLILSIYQKEKNNPRIKSSIIKLINDTKKIHKDGIGILAINSFNQKSEVLRGLKLDNQKLETIIANYDIINIHLRQATSGKINDANTHFWGYDNWFFAHNGIVQSFASADITDSYVFFRELLKTNSLQKNGTIDSKKLNKFINGTDFWGRFILANPKNKRIYYYGDYHLTMIDDKCLIISSANIENYLKNLSSFWGFKFENNPEYKINTQKIDGLLTMNLETKKHSIKAINRQINSHYTAYNNPYYNSTERDNNSIDWFTRNKRKQDYLDHIDTKLPL